eukprot:TRINITY_DN4937_c0_g1_i1.p2 TRINITY_DN4937_c0_g1~~TRINITY_DN4937_c0_g1_i1.p2  ORF type:complete len:183 (+),score=45.39 TRINITY_DN4937_c0_g1_i1:45-551(+)
MARGHAKRTKKTNSKDKSKRKAWGTKNRTKDLDQIHDEMQKGKRELPIDIELPGQGQHFCPHCDTFFITEDTLKRHFKGKPHRKRVKALQADPRGPYAGPQSEGLVLVDNGPRLNRHLDTPTPTTLALTPTLTPTLAPTPTLTPIPTTIITTTTTTLLTTSTLTTAVQ